ncbi:MAG: DEAD/DEAH box helicase [Clostridia bacterium]|nr:DEAD/DEAH box helicase [Clostridia bacterium]
MSDTVFDSFAPFIREFIYSRGWQKLHDVQITAAKVIFDTDHNLLIPSSTASGKTEAAFFPILSQIYEDDTPGIAVLYIAPLKSLINDQFGRITELTDEADIPVFHWHGDVARSHKEKMLRAPRGVLQITPESLESMLMRRGSDVIRLFGNLKYIIIDEIHTLTGTDRGNQILCQIARIARLIGYQPRRIGLSATIGDTDAAAAWLGAGSGRSTYVPELPREKLRWRLGIEHFYIESPTHDDSDPKHTGPSVIYDLNFGNIKKEIEKNESPAIQAQGASAILPDVVGEKEEKPFDPAADPGYEYIYDATKGRKSLVFSNSREETEYVTATLRQIAERRGERDVFLIHHGNLSAAIREEAEAKMKDEEIQAVTCATVTMELGIDIGKLERVVQLGSPNTVSSFLQRLGRSGRRGDPPEMVMVFREEEPLPNAPLPHLIPWELLKAIAVIQLYIENRFIEPPIIRKCPFSLLFQQTISILASSGSLTPMALGERVLSLPPFAHITKDQYRLLLKSMIDQEFLEMTEERELIVGLRGEKLTASFKFFAVFKDTEDFTVRSGSDEIGTITSAPPVGDRFALAGRVWEVEELDIPHRLIYVHPVKGKMEIQWPGDYGEVHTRILERMYQVLAEDTEYPYLKPDALERLHLARAVARNTGMLENTLVHLGGYTWAMFPWLGTRSFRTLRRYMGQFADEYKISKMEFEGCYYLMFRMERGDGISLLRAMGERIRRDGISLDHLIGLSECPVYEKYDGFIPAELLRTAFREDKLRSDEILSRSDMW